MGRRAFRSGISSRLLPALRAFTPQLVLISAGFDAAALDVGNTRARSSAQGLDLCPDDFFWATREIQMV